MDQDIQNIEFIYLVEEDYEQLKQVMIDFYIVIEDNYWNKIYIKMLIKKFFEGQVVIKVNGDVVGCVFFILICCDDFFDWYIYCEIIGNYMFDIYNKNGDMFYGIDVFIKFEFCGLCLGCWLYEYCKELCEFMNLCGILFGGWILNYYKYVLEMMLKEYIEKVCFCEIYDFVLNFQLFNDFYLKCVIKGYFEGDMVFKEYVVFF